MMILSFAARVLAGGPTLTIEVDGQVFDFEDHPVCGPTPLTRQGKPKSLPASHRFWHAVSRWVEQSKQVDANRRALWTEPPRDIADYVQVGRHSFPRATFLRLSMKFSLREMAAMHEVPPQ
jgi:hypothetical protein